MEFFTWVIVGAFLLFVLAFPLFLFAMKRDGDNIKKNPDSYADRVFTGEPAVTAQAAAGLTLAQLSELAADRGYEYVDSNKGPIGTEYNFRKIG